uniref:Uncharacterized protein MANES_08G162300 n=1 Tax=Rhizophora mucronata TaxID=61149 RepID=A0A2P2L4B3_RHIMU
MTAHFVFWARVIAQMHRRTADGQGLSWLHPCLPLSCFPLFDVSLSCLSEKVNQQPQQDREDKEKEWNFGERKTELWQILTFFNLFFLINCY